MELPVIGFVGLQGAILFLLFVALAVYGYYAGLNRLLTPLFVTLVALGLAVYPNFHGWASESVSLVFAKQSRYAAYLLIFFAAYFVLRFILGKLPRVVELGLPPLADKLGGALAGLVMAFAVGSMFLILLYGWRLPLDALYTRSDIGAFICKLWSQAGLLPELHSVLYRNPLTLI